jgi:hypothetical protein
MEDGRLVDAIEVGRAWARGEVRTVAAMKAEVGRVEARVEAKVEGGIEKRCAPRQG